MLYKEFSVGEKTYKLRLTSQVCVDVEKKLGKSVLDVLTSMAPDDMTAEGNAQSIKGMSLPLVGDIVTILHGALQKFQHGITLDDTFDIYDEYIDAGGSYMDFFDILRGVLEVSGFLPKEAEAQAEAVQAEANVPEA